MRQGARGVVGRRHRRRTARGTGLERPAGDRESRVPESGAGRSRILSRAGPGKSCLNLAVPSAKAEYYRETDSEPVP